MMDDSEGLAGLTGALEELFTNLGDSRLEALNEVMELQIISRVLLQNEALRVEKKFGGDHPRTRALQSSLEQNLSSIAEFTAETQIAAISIPEVDEDQTLIHGRVIEEEFRGVEGLFVSMADEEGKTLHSLGRSETDASGYYALVIDPDALQKTSEAVEEGVFLTISTRKGEIVYREFDPLEISEGERKLVEVVLDRRDLIGETRQPDYGRGVEHEEARAETPGEGSESLDEVELERVRGIGPKRADRLRQAGITDLQALAEADEESLREVLGNVDVREMKLEAAALLEK
jgi:hypothetical protein